MEFMKKIVAYGVRPNERAYFDRLNQGRFAMTYVEALLTHENRQLACGMDAVLVRGNCLVDRQNLEQFAAWGIRAVFTRSVGVNHIDLAAAHDLGITVARVPGYSPYAVAELALTLGLTLFRHVDTAVAQTRQGNFTVPPRLFGQELHTATVGIVGLGRIGRAEAQLYRALGARVVAFTPHPKDADRELVTFLSLPEVLAQSQLVSLHVPYLPGQNEHLVDHDFLQTLRPGAILVNTARGELVDTAAVLASLTAGRLGGYGTDVLPHEEALIGRDFSQAAAIPDPLTRQLVAHPNVVVTPHMGSYTVTALEDMIRMSYQNFQEWFTTGHVQNEV